MGVPRGMLGPVPACPFPSFSSLLWAESESTAGAAPSPPGSESPRGLGTPVSTARFGSGVWASPEQGGLQKFEVEARYQLYL